MGNRSPITGMSMRIARVGNRERGTTGKMEKGKEHIETRFKERKGKVDGTGRAVAFGGEEGRGVEGSGEPRFELGLTSCPHCPHKERRPCRCCCL
jgi:hypothetical protein